MAESKDSGRKSTTHRNRQRRRRSGADSRQRSQVGVRAGDRVDALVGIHCVREALCAGRREFRRLWVQDGPLRGELAALERQALTLGVPVERVDAKRLSARIDPDTRRANPQGILLEAGPLPAVALDELLSAGAGPKCLVFLDEVEDPQNVGAIARVAEGAGAIGMVISERHAPPLGAAVARASAGAIEWLPVAKVSNLGRALDAARETGFWTVGADLGPEAIPLSAVPRRLLRGDVALVLGAEGKGLRVGIRKRIDHPVSIPMRGHVASLNVSTAAAVLLYAVTQGQAESS